MKNAGFARILREPDTMYDRVMISPSATKEICQSFRMGLAEISLTIFEKIFSLSKKLAVVLLVSMQS